MQAAILPSNAVQCDDNASVTNRKLLFPINKTNGQEAGNNVRRTLPTATCIHASSVDYKSAVLSVGRSWTASLVSSSGVRQGCVLALVLFRIAIDWIMSENAGWSRSPRAQGSLLLMLGVLRRIGQHGGRHDPSKSRERERETKREFSLFV